MPEYIATTVGLFPLPDRARNRLSDLKGHQRQGLISGHEPAEIVSEYDAARDAVVETQLDAGLGRIVEGQLRWDDMLAHPLAVNEAVETRGLVRYYDNNNFYRDPVVVDDLHATGDIGTDLASTNAGTDGVIQAVLPGPYTLAALATDEHYGDDAAFLAAIADLLAGEVGAFPPVETLFLLEPSLVASPPGEDEQARVGDAIDAVATEFAGEVVVHTYWGALDELTHGTLQDASIDAVGYDLVTAPAASRNLVEAAGTHDAVALGAVDGQNTDLESPGVVRDRIEAFVSAVPNGVDTVYVTPNTELFYLPVQTFEAKLDVLAGSVSPEVAA